MEINRSASAKIFHVFIAESNPAQKTNSNNLQPYASREPRTTEVHPFITTSKEDATLGQGLPVKREAEALSILFLRWGGRICHQKANKKKKLENPNQYLS